MTEYDVQSFYEGLVKHRLIVPVGVQGAFGRGTVFEDVLERFDRLIMELAKADGAEVFTYPPVISRAVFEQSEFMDSFPQLHGSVASFFGKEKDAKELSQRIHEKKPWGDMLGMTDVVLTPAACYPVYPSFTGTLPEKGGHVTLMGWVFRHEPSPEPTRMLSFRVREFIRVGSPETVVEWRDLWLKRGVQLLESLELPARPDVASDPFFGRGGKMLAVSQKEQKLKFEVLVPVISRENPTAVCSFNYHQDHFGKTFDIKTGGGETAHTACLGFGMERVVMSMFKTHGFDVEKWPATVRKKLWP